jgi:drug/metabolite transporter (DMT)-like permease
LTRNDSTSSSPAERHRWRGYLYIAAAAAFWGASATLGRALFTGRLLGGEVRELDPVILSQMRTTFSFVVLAPLLLLRGGTGALRLERSEFLRCLVLGVLGLAGANYFYYLAIQETNVATAIILQYSAPIWVLLYMVARGFQRPTAKRVGAVAMAVAGSALAIGLVGEARLVLNGVGVMAALAAAVSFSFYNVYGHKLVGRNDRFKVILYALLGSALFWIIFNPPWVIWQAGYTGGQWLVMLVFAFASMLIPFSFYVSGLHHLDATRAIVTSCLEPVFAIGMAAMFLGEKFGWIQALGMLVVLAATIVVQMPESPSARNTRAEAAQRD